MTIEELKLAIERVEKAGLQPTAEVYFATPKYSFKNRLTEVIAASPVHKENSPNGIEYLILFAYHNYT